MVDPQNPAEERVPCQVCSKEVPMSEAMAAEAVDYVAYFCGNACYAKWNKAAARSGNAGKGTQNN